MKRVSKERCIDLFPDKGGKLMNAFANNSWNNWLAVRILSGDR